MKNTTTEMMNMVTNNCTKRLMKNPRMAALGLTPL